MKKVCILSPIHQSNDVRIFQKEAKTIQNIGFKVSLLARTTEENPKTNMEGITLLKSPEYNNRFQRFLSQTKVLKMALNEKADIYHLHNPDMLPIGFLLKAIGKKVIYDTHEDFSKRILMREWIPLYLRKSIAKLIELLEIGAGKFFDACIVTQPQLKDKMGSKTILLENAPVLNSNLIKKAYKLYEQIPKEKDVLRLIYVGGISNIRGIKESLLALEKVNESIDARIWLIGPSFDAGFIKELKKNKGWDYVDYLGTLPQEEAFAYMLSADVGLVTILDIGDHSTTSPNKLHEYQRFALPFIASNFDSWVDKLKKVDSGLFVEPTDIEKLVAAILYLAKDKDLRKSMGKRGQEYIFSDFNWNLESEKLVELYYNFK